MTEPKYSSGEVVAVRARFVYKAAGGMLVTIGRGKEKVRALPWDDDLAPWTSATERAELDALAEAVQVVLINERMEKGSGSLPPWWFDLKAAWANLAAARVDALREGTTNTNAVGGSLVVGEEEG